LDLYRTRRVETWICIEPRRVGTWICIEPPSGLKISISHPAVQVGKTGLQASESTSLCKFIRGPARRHCIGGDCPDLTLQAVIALMIALIIRAIAPLWGLR